MSPKGQPRGMLVSAAAAAEELGLARESIIAWIRGKVLRGTCVQFPSGRHRWYVSRESLDALRASLAPVDSEPAPVRRAGEHEWSGDRCRRCGAHRSWALARARCPK